MGREDAKKKSYNREGIVAMLKAPSLPFAGISQIRFKGLSFKDSQKITPSEILLTLEGRLTEITNMSRYIDLKEIFGIVCL